MNFKQRQEEKIEHIEAVIKSYLPEETGYQQTVIKAANYSMLAGGKRLRPMLVQETFALFGGTGSVVESFMAAIEMIHTYSLVHDDLPAMDNDEYRRGKKTTHVVFGEAMAILAGDGLLNLAFETAASALERAVSQEEARQIAKALLILAKKAGVYGMIGGQTADIEAEGADKPLSKEQLLFIHENKTAALIQSAMMIGATLAGAGEKEVQKIETCACNVGIAFQIKDDILDVEGEENLLGKPIGSDEKNQKMTYVRLMGMEASKAEVDRLSREAIAIIKSFDHRNEFLELLIESMITRQK